MRTQVGIVGAGPAGLLLSHLLAARGIESIIVENRSRAYCEQRLRAGVLEHDAARSLVEAGVGDRMLREGLIDRGVALRFGGRSRRIDFAELTGKTITVYGQQEAVKDMIEARLASGGRIDFEVDEVSLHDIAGTHPTIHYRDRNGDAQELSCDYIAGCDGYHGISRPSIPAGIIKNYERVYPFGWLGILAQARPVSDELI
jgi:p-hydroxybenzoate 3-monooxygenase